MTEDELLTGLLDACYVGGWLVHHVRRSDLGLQQGHAGFPDIVAVHPRRRLAVAIEAKSATGRSTEMQTAWLAALAAAGLDARTVRPADYDVTWRWLVGDRLAPRCSRLRPDGARPDRRPRAARRAHPASPQRPGG